MAAGGETERTPPRDGCADRNGSWTHLSAITVNDLLDRPEWSRMRLFFMVEQRERITKLGMQFPGPVAPDRQPAAPGRAILGQRCHNETCPPGFTAGKPPRRKRRGLPVRSESGTRPGPAKRQRRGAAGISLATSIRPGNPGIRVRSIQSQTTGIGAELSTIDSSCLG